MADQELERFKTEIDLCAFAAAHGYARDARESSRNCEVMRTPNGDKIVIVKHLDNKSAEHWIYYCVRDERDNGTIIDFLQWRGGGSLGQIRKTLREWLGGSRVEVGTYHRPQPLRAISRDRTGVLLAWEKARPVSSLEYLTERGLGPELLKLPAFADAVRVDARGNAMFPHYDREGLCGFEVKNRGFTGFAAGGMKGLWYSRAFSSAGTLVFCESAIDAISYYALNGGTENMRVMSVGGALNASQVALIRAAIEKLPPGSRVVLAFDADEGGQKLAEAVKEGLAGEVELRRDLPPVGMGKDWNEALKIQRGIVDRPTHATVAPDHGKTPPLSSGRNHQKESEKGPANGPKGRKQRNRR